MSKDIYTTPSFLVEMDSSNKRWNTLMDDLDDFANRWHEYGWHGEVMSRVRLQLLLEPYENGCEISDVLARAERHCSREGLGWLPPLMDVYRMPSTSDVPKECSSVEDAVNILKYFGYQVGKSVKPKFVNVCLS